MERHHQDSVNAVGIDGSTRSTKKILSTGQVRLDATRVNREDFIRSDVEDTEDIIQDEFLTRVKLYETKKVKKANSTAGSPVDESQECVGENVCTSHQNMSSERRKKSAIKKGS